MLLSELKNSIKQAQRISLTDLSMRLKEDSSVIYAMLQHLIHKGLVTEDGEAIACKAKCTACHLTAQLVFSWKPS